MAKNKVAPFFPDTVYFWLCPFLFLLDVSSSSFPSGFPQYVYRSYVLHSSCKWHLDILLSPWPQLTTCVPQWSATISRSTNYHTSDSSLTYAFTQLISALRSVVTMQSHLWTLILFDITAPLLQYTTPELWCLSGGKREDYQNCSVLYCVYEAVHSHKHT